MNNIIGDKLFIVGGAPRSGTSITQAVLNSHSQIYGGPEFDRILNIVETRNTIIESIMNGRIDVFCTVGQANREFGKLIEALLYPVREKHDRKYLSEKTPSNVLVFEELFEMLPGAKFIHVVRDPRAVINSMLQVSQRHLDSGLEPPNFISDLENALNTVKKYVDAGYYATLKKPDRVYTLVFESLVLQPKETTKSLCDFLDINWEESMIYPDAKEHPAEKLLFKDGGIWSGGISKFANLDPDKLTKWGKTLSQETINSISTFFQNYELYQTIGYDL